MTDVLFKCPECSKHLAADEAAKGRAVKCVDCGQSVQVPEPAITFKCPSCTWDLSAPSGAVGQRFHCPNCGDEIDIPSLPRLHLSRRQNQPKAGPRPESIRRIQPVFRATQRAAQSSAPAIVGGGIPWGWVAAGLVVLLFFGVLLPKFKKSAAEADRKRSDFLKNASPEQIGMSMLTPGQRAEVKAMTAVASNGKEGEAIAGRPRAAAKVEPPRNDVAPRRQSPQSLGGRKTDAAGQAMCRPERGDTRFPVALNGRWGYIDAKGKLVVTPIFRDAMDFSEGVAAVKADDKWGYVDATGRLVVSPVYDSASEFSEGLAAVRRGPLWGYVDGEGTMAIAPQFPTADKFSDGLAAVRGPSSTLVGYVDRRGDWAIRPRFIHGRAFSGGLAAVWTIDGGDAPWGFIAKDGTFAIAPRFTFAFGFSEGLAAVAEGMVRQPSGGLVPGKCCYIDATGRPVITPGSDDITSFSDGLAHVRVDGRQGFMDKTGQWRIRPRFDDAMTFSEGMAPVSIGGKWGFVDTDGRLAIPCRYDLALPFMHGLSCVIVGEKMGYIGRDGHYIWEPTLVLDSLHAAKFQLIRR